MEGRHAHRAWPLMSLSGFMWFFCVKCRISFLCRLKLVGGHEPPQGLREDPAQRWGAGEGLCIAWGREDALSGLGASRQVCLEFLSVTVEASGGSGFM